MVSKKESIWDCKRRHPVQKVIRIFRNIGLNKILETRFFFSSQVLTVLRNNSIKDIE